MASLSSYLPSPGKVSWRLDTTPNDVAEGNKVRHVMIRSAEVWEKPSPHVMYKVEVVTEYNQWYLYRRYSEFHTLHRKLMKLHAVHRDLLPPKRYHGNLSKQLIDQRRLQLETYLQRLIHSEARISQSTELQTFLDVSSHDIVKITDFLARHLHRHGDELLMQAKPVALSVNEMFSITKRLKLPFDASGVDTSDPAADPANLYGFLHHLQSLRVCLPPSPVSICCMPFDLSHFRSLTTLKIDRVPLSQVKGLLSIQQQITKLSALRCVRTIRELIIENVEEKRCGGSPILRPRSGSGVEKWRVTAMAKLTENRMVIQPWHSLQILNLPHNKITHLDDSLQVLPVLRELNLSHNTIQLLEVQFLCLPSLQKLNLAHNAIKKIIDGKNVLETVTSLNLSHNRLHSLNGLSAFVSVTGLNLNYNLVGSKKDLHQIMKLRHLKTLCLQGNPISSSQSSRLLLLAQFLHRSRDIQLDGEDISEREQSKITSYKNRYGDDPDEWPLVQSVITQPDSSSHSNSSSGDAGADDESDPFAESRPRPLSDARGQRSDVMCNTDDSSDTSCPNVEISWQIHAPGDYRGSPISRLSRDRIKKPPPPTSNPTSSLPGSYTTGREWGGYDGGLTASVESSVAQALISPSLLASQLHQGKNMFPDERTEEGYAIGSLSHSEFTASLSMRDEPLLTSVRDEPDGQSENSEVTPPSGLRHTVTGASDPPSLSITPPPPTPLTINGTHHPKPQVVSPSMIQAALEALQQIEDKQRPLSLTPNEPTTGGGVAVTTPVLPEAVTSALTAWISRQNSSASATATPLVSPPPSTPLETSLEYQPCRPISASDLIAALSSLIPTATVSMATNSLSPLTSSQEIVSSSVSDVAVKGGEGEEGEGGGVKQNVRELSNPCTVPSTTPQEGLEGWKRLGIRPEDVIQALSALTIQEPHRAKFEESFSTLSPITEERPKFPLEPTSGGLGMGEPVYEREGGEGEGVEGKECAREEKGERGGEGAGKGIEGKRESILSWDADEITEITFSGSRSVGKSTTSGAVSMATTTSLDADVGDYSCSGLPSSADMSDSENSVFSPELTIGNLVKSHPLSPSDQHCIGDSKGSDSSTNPDGFRIGRPHPSSEHDSMHSSSCATVVGTKQFNPDPNVGGSRTSEHETLRQKLSTTVAMSSALQQQQCDSSDCTHSPAPTSTIDGKAAHQGISTTVATSEGLFRGQPDSSTCPHTSSASNTSSAIDVKATEMSREQLANRGPIQTACSKEHGHTSAIDRGNGHTRAIDRGNGHTRAIDRGVQLTLEEESSILVQTQEREVVCASGGQLSAASSLPSVRFQQECRDGRLEEEEGRCEREDVEGETTTS